MASARTLPLPRRLVPEVNVFRARGYTLEDVRQFYQPKLDTAQTEDEQGSTEASYLADCREAEEALDQIRWNRLAWTATKLGLEVEGAPFGYDRYRTLRQRINEARLTRYQRGFSIVVPTLSLVVALLALNNARNAANAAAGLARFEQRAWLVPQAPLWMVMGAECNGNAPRSPSLPTLPTGARLSACISVINGGKTPAFNVRHRTVVRFAPDHEALPKTKLVEDRSVIFPNSPGIVFPSEPSDPNPSVPGMGSRMPVFVVATICYDDVFGRQHFTRTCGVMGPKDDPSHLSYCSGKSGDDVDASEEEARRVCAP